MSVHPSVWLTVIALQVGATPALAQHKHGTPATTKPASAATAPDSAAIVATVARFHALLESGDTLGVARLLAPDLTVLESGGLETRAEYLSHHLHSDAAFAKAVPGERRITVVAQKGDVAWTVAESTAKGTFRDRPVNSRGAELIVLSRTDSGWMINAIHWSSRRLER